jgi:hypothetical protein
MSWPKIAALKILQKLNPDLHGQVSQKTRASARTRMPLMAESIFSQKILALFPELKTAITSWE